MNDAASGTRSDGAVQGRMRNGLDALQADSARIEAAAATALQGCQLEHGAPSWQGVGATADRIGG